MGLLDSIFRRAPGVIASGLRGAREGREYQDKIEREAMMASLAERRARAAEESVDIRGQLASLKDTIDRGRLANDTARTGNATALVQPRIGEIVARTGLTDARTDTELERPDLVRAQTGLTEARTETEGHRPGLIDAQTAAAMARAAAAGAAGGRGQGRTLPASAVANIAGYKSILAAAQDAQTGLKEAVDAGLNTTGPIKGRVSSLTQAFPNVFGKADSRVVSAQARLSNVTSEIMKQRSGGAVTDAEFERLKPFLASRNDDEATAAQKLTDLISYLNRTLETTQSEFSESGYNVPGMGGAPTAGGEDKKARAARLLAELRAGKP